MRRYIISLNINVNGKKIDAIKALRSATGMGLAESKTFVETPNGGFGDTFGDNFGGDLIVNGEQVAALYLLHRDGVPGSGFGSLGPCFTIEGLKAHEEPNLLDISSNTL